jgi:centromeric protein E
MADKSSNAIKVAIRVRPLNSMENKRGDNMGWEWDDENLIDMSEDGRAGKTWKFDALLPPTVTQEAVYNAVASEIVEKAIAGYNGTVFSYGQTGSGKTWSTMGIPSEPGIIPRSIEHIFSIIESTPDVQFLLRASYLEVYNEQINDLLAEENQGKNLRIMADDPLKGAIIKDLIEEIVISRDGLAELIERGESNRHYGSTNMNANSSRSHTIYRLIVEAKRAGAGQTSVSYLNLVDLAGSEKQKNTGASGKQLKEGSNINKSLLTLGVVISKLGEVGAGKRKNKTLFIPYRDSKMTRILKNSLGGNTRTSIICAMGPSQMAKEETIGTLKFGMVCKSIQNKAKKNEVTDSKTLLLQYKKRIDELTSQLQAAHDGGGGVAVIDETKLNELTGELTKELEDEKQRRLDTEAKVDKLKQLVIVAGQVDESAPMQAAGVRGQGKKKYRQSINVCVNASTDWGRSSHASTAQLFNITEDDNSEAQPVQGVRRASKRTSVAFGQGGGFNPSFNVWKEKSMSQQEDVNKLNARIEQLESELADASENSVTMAEHQQDMTAAEQEMRAEEQELEQLRQQVVLLQSEKEMISRENISLGAKVAEFEGQHHDSTKVVKLEFQLQEARQETNRMREQVQDSQRKGTSTTSQMQANHSHEIRELHAEMEAEREALTKIALSEQTRSEAQILEVRAEGARANETRAQLLTDANVNYVALEGQYQACQLRADDLQQRVDEMDSTVQGYQAQFDNQSIELRRVQAELDYAQQTLSQAQVQGKAHANDEKAHAVEALRIELEQKESDVQVRFEFAKKMEVEWQSRHSDVVQLLASLEKSGRSPGESLTQLMQRWEDRTNSRLSMLPGAAVAQSMAAYDDVAAPPAPGILAPAPPPEHWVNNQLTSHTQPTSPIQLPTPLLTQPPPKQWANNQITSHTQPTSPIQLPTPLLTQPPPEHWVSRVL